MEIVDADSDANANEVLGCGFDRDLRRKFIPVLISLSIMRLVWSAIALLVVDLLLGRFG